MAQKTEKNLEHDFIKQYVGKNVEIMLRPDIPVVSGRLIQCNENYVAIGDALLAYPLIWGIRPVNNDKHDEPKRPVISVPVTEQKGQKELVQQKTEPLAPKEPKEKIEQKKEFEPESKIEWLDKILEGELAYFSHTFGFILSPDLKKFKVPILEEGKIFIHYNQISDPDLRAKLLQLRTEKNNYPKIEVTFKIGSNEKGYVADDVREKKEQTEQKTQSPEKDLLSINIASALSEEGEIEYYRRYEDVPHGKIRTKGNKLYTFYEEDVTDPALSVFLECSPSAEGQLVRFNKIEKGKKILIRNLEAAAPFPEERLNEWEKSGLLQKAKERMGLIENDSEMK